MLIAGFCLTLFTNHRRLTVVLRKDNSKTLVKVSGSSRKLKAEFRTMIEGAVLGVLKASPTPFSSEEGRHLEQVQS
jgi:hypothetical protein